VVDEPRSLNAALGHLTASRPRVRLLHRPL
jgi:hypothetical protein